MLHGISEKLIALRQEMAQQHIDACVVMSADPHMSEYLPAYWQARVWLSGFTGSVGTAVVTQEFAGVWVDGRYWVQAQKQLSGTGFVLQKLTPDDSSTHVNWLAKTLPENAVIAVDGRAISMQQYAILDNAVAKKNITIKTDIDLITPLWSDRPALPQAPIHQMKAGLNAQSRQEKIATIRQQLHDKKIEAHFVSALDDVAWLLNCRGEDVAYNPVFLAHLLLTPTTCTLFVDAKKISSDLKQALANDGIHIMDYAQSVAELNALSAKSILLDANKVSIEHRQALPEHMVVETDINPSTLLKACKADSEIDLIKHAMKKDGVALAHFFTWLEQAIDDEKSISELSIDEKLIEFRSQQPGFIGASFATIAGFNENGALPHYRATKAEYASIVKNGLLLIDSGAQYDEGTTDITRMVAVGELSSAQKRDCTLVLKSHIALSQAVFPEGLAAPLLDAIARQPLWQHQLDYRHGTGHGVGFALNVHEGPQVLSYYAPITPYSKMLAGMVTSNEPGLYHEGHYGIRIENLVVNRKLPEQGAYGQFLHFETLTLCPISTACLAIEQLSASEKTWLNDYHAWVREQLSPELTGAPLAWLIQATEAI